MITGNGNYDRLWANPGTGTGLSPTDWKSMPVHDALGSLVTALNALTLRAFDDVFPIHFYCRIQSNFRI